MIMKLAPRHITSLLLVLLTIALHGCSKKQTKDYVFETLSSDSTGIQFSNQLQPSPEFNLFSYMYYYNGAGVGAGDVNNDGLTDLFFASNQHQNTLYLNKGQMHFEDITAKAGIPTDSLWSTGVAMADINADGLLDIYVCRVSQFKILTGSNQLLICQGIDEQGIPHYKDEAAAYGLNFSGFSTQAAFLDYDLDGDLDMFLLNHSVNHDGNYAPRAQFITTTDSLAGHRFYRNDSKLLPDGKFIPAFTNVTAAAGINSSRIGYGLGIAVSDINLDGWPDIYIGNDFHENDYLYLNQQNGTFSEEGTKRIKHTSQFSMGVDAADINNDAWPDIISMDMLPNDPYMLRRSLSEDAYDIFQHKLAYGYSYQYARNNLQLNLRNGYFSEIGQYAGIYATDWSWSAMLMDFDNDGWKDLFVSNGIPKRMNDIDYINFVSGEELQNKLRNNGIQDKDLALINKFPEIKLPNQFFRNNGALQFDDMAEQVGNISPTFSNGAAYADLDNDGDLDIVVNNINDKALIYRNNAQKDTTKNSFLSIELKGPTGNTSAIGAKVLVWQQEQVHLYEMQPVHGFLSSMHAPVHIGLGKQQPDSIQVVWPDNTVQRINKLSGGRQTVNYASGLPAFDYNHLQQHRKPASKMEVQDLTEQSGLRFAHQENAFNEFDREALMPKMLSSEGPALAVADINHDGLEDIFLGGAKTIAGQVWMQQSNGKFMQMPEPALQADSMWEHVDAQWADLNGDSHPDLVIATGGNEYFGNDPHLQPLLYLNDGSGKLTKKENAFGEVYATQSKILVQDFTGDGIPDLFVAGRAVPWQYGITPSSYLLQNNGQAQFSDVTAQWCPALQLPGMVTDALFTDLNKDKKPDLVLCYEWSGIDAFYNEGKGFKQTNISQASGWWQCLYASDIDNDGDIDFIAGNYGLNNRLKASDKEPVKLYVNDFDGNGRTEQVMTYFLKGQEIPFASKLQLEKQMPSQKKKFLYAEAFAKASVQEMFGKEKLNQSQQWQANYFANSVLINDGKGKFSLKPLPALAQLSTIRCIIQTDANSDKLPDYLVLGNFTQYHVEMGRQDANYGTLLINKGNGEFGAEVVKRTLLDGEVRRISYIQVSNEKAFVLARNNGNAQIISLQ
jgi:hypothetical protein